jgi:hypothetical protein
VELDARIRDLHERNAQLFAGFGPPDSMDLRERIAATAVSIAETEDWVADTFDHLARVRPHDAERLHARAAHARWFAARERAQAAIYRSPAPEG